MIQMSSGSVDEFMKRSSVCVGGEGERRGVYESQIEARLGSEARREEKRERNIVHKP